MTSQPCFECGSTERIGTACKPCNPEITDPSFGMTQPHQIDRERDYPAEFEAWWADYRHRNREPADYTVKKQIAFDAFYFGACDRPAPMEAVAWREKVARAVAMEIARQDDHDEWQPEPDWDLTWSYIDQRDADFGKIADAILAQISTHPVQASAPKAVAWVLPDDLKRLADPRDPLDHINVWGHRAWTGFVPLYTHPVQGGEG